MSLDQYNWIKEKPIDGGNQQSKAFIVINADDSNSPKYFLKELVNDNNEEKRRKRFLRESTCYRTLDHPSIPKFIHCNAEDNKSSVSLYSYRINQWAMDVDQASNLTKKLLDIVEYIHSENTFHRDIKHDNIILRNDSINDSILVDFGMSFLLIE